MIEAGLKSWLVIVACVCARFNNDILNVMVCCDVANKETVMNGGRFCCF